MGERVPKLRRGLSVRRSRRYDWEQNKENDVPTRDKTRKLTKAMSDTTDGVLRDVKASANKTFTSVRSRFGSFSERLRKLHKLHSLPNGKPYGQLQNDKVTPVKLYSPFNFVTPSPHKRDGLESGYHRTPKRCMFVSPTGKLKKDVDDIATGLQDLKTVSKSLRHKILKK